MTEGSYPKSVAIIGSGITGLLLAHGLLKNGFKVDVYEKEAYIGERVREWTMLLHWALPTLKALLPDNILGDIRTAYTDPFYPYDLETERVPFYNAVSGELAFLMPAASMRRISRTKMRKLCSRGLDIHWGKSFRDFRMADEGPVTICFEDGSTTEADFVVGADGPNSSVRRWLLGDEAGRAKASDHAICSGIVKYNDAEVSKFVRVHPVASSGLTPLGSLYLGVQDVPDPEKPETWAFHFVRMFRDKLEPLEGDEAISRIKAISQDLKDPPFFTAIQRIPSGSKVFTTQLHYWDTVPWDSRGSRVVIAGDAAHAMLPSRGQGLNHALDDALKLVVQLTRAKDGETPLHEAIKAYQDEVVTRGSKAALGSLDDAEANTRVQFGANPLAQKGISG